MGLQERVGIENEFLNIHQLESMKSEKNKLAH